MGGFLQKWANVSPIPPKPASVKEAERGALPQPDPAELAHATALLNQAGVRIMRLETGDAIGVWSDLDSAAVRNALLTLGAGELPVRYLDGPGVPLRYKSRRVPGDPVPNSVREAMERSSEPWKVRSQMPCNFVPWPVNEPTEKPHTIDSATGIWPIAEWGARCGRGFRTNRQAARKRP